jgi:hypothetical protein
MKALDPKHPVPSCAPVQTSLRPHEVTRERIENADSYLHGVGLPGYLEVAGALSRMVLSFGDMTADGAVIEAREVLKRLEVVMAASMVRRG